MKPYDPANWHWTVAGDATRAFSSASVMRKLLRKIILWALKAEPVKHGQGGARQWRRATFAADSTNG